MLYKAQQRLYGILQAISITGFTTYASTIPIILGQNIGTCFTSILSSIGATKNAKRTAAVHLYFNLIGTVIFMVVIYTYQNVVGFPFWNDVIDMGGIANFHLIFNIVSTVILLPCVGLLEKLTLITIKDKKNTDDDEDNDYLSVLTTLDERITSIPSLAIANSLNVILKMGEVAEKNFRRASYLIDKFETKKLEHIQEREDVIDKMDVSLANFLVKIGNLDISEQDNKTVTALLKIESEFEKIGDYAFKLSKVIENINEKELKFSQEADKELKVMYNIVEDTLIRTIEILRERDLNSVTEIEALRKVSKTYREKYKMAHIERLKEGKCSVEAGITFIEILSVYEKIIGHCINISVASMNYRTDEAYITKHEYFDEIHKNDINSIKTKVDEFKEKYEMLERDDKLSII